MTRARKTAVVAAVAIAAATATAPALAAAVSRATASAPTTVGTWSATLGPTGGSGATAPYVINNGALTQGIVPVYFSVYNSGTLPLLGSSWLAVNSKPSGSAPPTISLEACVGGTWNTTPLTGGACSGTVVPLTNSDATVATPVSLAIPVGGSVQVKAYASRLLNFPQAFTTTVTVSVARSQAAAGSIRTA